MSFPAELGGVARLGPRLWMTPHCVAGLVASTIPSGYSSPSSASRPP